MVYRVKVFKHINANRKQLIIVYTLKLSILTSSLIYYLTYYSNKVTYYHCDFFIFHKCIVDLQCDVNFWFTASDSGGKF